MTNDEREIWKRLNECEAVKKVFAMWIGEDRFIRQDINMVLVCYLNLMRTSDIWIPPLFDPIRPERSLIGIYRAIHPDYGSKENHDFLAAVMYAVRPDLALARAIIEQEGK